MLQAWFDNLHSLIELETQREAVWWAMIAALTGVASLVVSGLALLGLFRSLAQTRESLEEGKRRAFLETRPWIVIKDIKFSKPYINIEDQEKHLVLSIKVSVENTGLLPARFGRIVGWIGGFDPVGSEELMQKSIAERPHDHVEFPPRVVSGYEDVIRVKILDRPDDEPAFIEVSVLYRVAETSEVFLTTAISPVERDDGSIIRVDQLHEDYPLARAGTIEHLNLT